MSECRIQIRFTSALSLSHQLDSLIKGSFMSTNTGKGSLFNEPYKGLTLAYGVTVTKLTKFPEFKIDL